MAMAVAARNNTESRGQTPTLAHCRCGSMPFGPTAATATTHPPGLQRSTTFQILAAAYSLLSGLPPCCLHPSTSDRRRASLRQNSTRRWMPSHQLRHCHTRHQHILSSVSNLSLRTVHCTAIVRPSRLSLSNLHLC